MHHTGKTISDPIMMLSKPAIKGTRIPTELVLRKPSASIQNILQMHCIEKKKMGWLLLQVS